jgi:hypothetical protein
MQSENSQRILITDDQLREQIKIGASPEQVAQRYGMGLSTVYRRMKKLGIATAVTVTTPATTRPFVHGQLHAIDQLTRSLQRVNLLQDACDEWLRDADDPKKYNVGPHAEEVKVTYEVSIATDKGERIERRKKPLEELLAVLDRDDDGARIVCNSLNGEFKHADPREVLLKTAQETRSTIAEAAGLARMLADMRAMMAFREALLAAIAQVDEDVARKIAAAVQRTTVLRGAIGDVSPVVLGDSP